MEQTQSQQPEPQDAPEPQEAQPGAPVQETHDDDAPQLPESAEAGAPEGEEEQVRRRVVVAEDEALIRMDIVEILRSQGYEVLAEAANGEEAVALAREYTPDLVLMDVKMPKMDGISAAEIITEEKIAPVVLLTAFSQKELVDRATEAGAMAYVVKPFTENDLVPAIEVAISRYEQIRQLEKEVTGLQEQFETRKLVDRAKSLLITKMGLTEPEAFRWIQKTSMDRRLSMREVAETIVSQIK